MKAHTVTLATAAELPPPDKAGRIKVECAAADFAALAYRWLEMGWRVWAWDVLPGSTYRVHLRRETNNNH